MSGIAGYSLAGLDAEIMDALRGDLGERSIRHARMVQGEVGWADTSEEERSAIVRAWEDLQLVH